MTGGQIGPDCPEFCDAFSRMMEIGVTKNRTYIHLAIGSQFERDSNGIDGISNSLNCGCAFSGSGIGPHQIGSTLFTPPWQFKGTSSYRHPDPSIVCSQTCAQKAVGGATKPQGRVGGPNMPADNLRGRY